MQSLKSEKLEENPRERANIISKMMFCYTLPILCKGRKKTLEHNDLYRALNEHKSDALGNKLYKSWQKEVKSKRENKKKPKLLNALKQVFGLQVLLSAISIGLIEFGTKVSQPFCLAGLIAYFAGDDDQSKSKAHWYIGAIVLATITNVIVMHPYAFMVYHLGMKMRIALCSIIFRKALRLSHTALGDTTIGQIVNLMSNDVGRFDTVLTLLNFLWLAPLQLIVITYLMYREISVAAFFGVGVLIFFLPIQSYLGKLISKLRLRTAKTTDERVRMMNEIISGIQVIKMYAWEKPFGKLVEKIRIKELNVIKCSNYIRGILLACAMFLSHISIFSSLVCFVLLQNVLDAEKAFLVTAYFNILRRTMTMYFPLGIAQFAEIIVSIRRIEDFMLREETQGRQQGSGAFQLSPSNADIDETDELKENVQFLENHLKKPNQSIDIVDGGIVEIANLKAKWDLVAAEYTLNDVSLELKPKQLIAVVGPVGSGKSSLIQAILGELPAMAGKVHSRGTNSYAAQEPWLFTGSVRDNILFGLPMHKQRYYTVIKKCALERDFDLLPYGDRTLVGERGTSLSGGQKARISLARAVYREADIYLLDDPLSAVDTHVASHLFDQCVCGFLKNKAVLLVTHQLQFLEQADLIVVMDKGSVSAMGTYNEMLHSGLDFAQLLSNKNDIEAAGADDASKQTIRQRYNTQKSNESERGSMGSRSSITDSIAQEQITHLQEKRVEGKIDSKLYLKYFSAGGGVFMFVLFMFFTLGSQLLGSGADYFLAYWVNKNKSLNLEASDNWDLYWFTALNVFLVIFTLMRTVTFTNMAKRASHTLHNKMFHGLICTAMYFFHVNPSGRILNRFSKDLGQIDEILPLLITDTLQCFLNLTGIVVVVCLTNPWYIIITLALVIIFNYMRNFYLNTSRDVKRLEAIARSPIYSHLSATLHGLSTIRALEAEKLLIAEFDNYQDVHSSAYYAFISTNRAFGYYIDFFCALYISAITISFLFYTPRDAGEVGLAITQSMGITGIVQWALRQSAELENLMTAVERVVEYGNLEPEADFVSKSHKKPPQNWPEMGEIVAKDLSLRYMPEPQSDCVLKAINFEIKSCEKVGIVGRTGAGKSTLINAIFRLSFNEGDILIDQRNINDLGLHDLRSKISIIPQEPVLFSGSMRYNLDPFEQYDDARLWDALEEVKLKQAIAEMPSALQSKITEGGNNFSVGQRQLVCLARAILRENKILVMDEATANVDPQTDALIQLTIRNKFKNCTVLTIAHRLHTIMDSDKVLVLDAGQVVEFGTPYELLTLSKTKIFHGMCMQTGKATYEHLLKIAQKAHDEKL